MLTRYLEAELERHLKQYRQMVFLAGPRQVGKTTLARNLLGQVEAGVNYFNWDIQKDRKILTTQVFPGKFPLNQKNQDRIVFDEIHKYPRWKNTIKGLFDKQEPKTHWIVTGSAGLNIYRRGQDSLLGRHFTYHLCPFSLAEILGGQQGVATPKQLSGKNWSNPSQKDLEIFETLFQFGGFPEPFFKQEVGFLKRWRTTRLERLIHQDLASTENLKNLPLVENLMFLLPERVGSLLSINSLREDLEVHFATVKHWLELLERIFYCFTIHPYSKKLARAIRKESKLYLWDWTEVEEEGKRFENLAALHLLKYVYYMNDLGLADVSLHFLRDKEKHEVDFLLCEDKKPIIGIECKSRKQEPSKDLVYFAKKLNLKKVIQLVAKGEKTTTCLISEVPVEIIPAVSFLKELI